ncbi:MAG: hydroxyacylglutathione hydrolase [Myxococcota bacterium]|nr:hydroxyacylglutathione hydrolase [Myxococcota bacterium]
MKHVVSVPNRPIVSNDGRLEVHQVLSWEDNLIWLLVDSKTREAAVVDGPEAQGVLDYCASNDLSLTTIFNTHTHGDHIGINRDLQARGMLSDLRVVGSEARKNDIPGVNELVSDGTKVSFGSCEGVALLTEGHIDGHISYLFQEFLFSGDTLFAGGCGYLFDGPASKMHDSLSRLSRLPKDTLVFCAHEYTEDNLKFAWSLEPNNRELRARIEDVLTQRQSGGSTVPSTIGDELNTNPFLRVHNEELRAKILEFAPETDMSIDSEVFAATRALKDSKRYRETLPVPLPTIS